MKVGDKVIINPNIPDGAWSKYDYGFHSKTMMKPGILTLEREHDIGGFYIGDYVYDEDWLLPTPLFREGDKVRIREDLTIHDDVPFSVNCEMEELAGSTFTVVAAVHHGDCPDSCLGFDGCRYALDGEAGSWSWSSPMFDLTNYKIKSNESRLQEQESPLRRGSGEIVCGICCRKHKPRVTVKSVSYKKVIGRG